MRGQVFMDFNHPYTIAVTDKHLSCLSSVSAYLSRTGRKVVFALYSFAHPVCGTIKQHRVYVERDLAESCDCQDEVVGFAVELSKGWIQQQRIRHWKATIIVLCRPLRVDRKPALIAISALLRTQYGNFWGSPAGRHALFERLTMEFPDLSVRAPP